MYRMSEIFILGSCKLFYFLPFMSGGVVGKLRERTDHFGGEHELDSTDPEAILVVGRREIHGGCTWPDGVHVAA
jgi:hypothetical protein